MTEIDLDVFFKEHFENIDNIIIDTMIEDGPDGHCDGHGLISEKVINYIKINLRALKT